MLLAVFSNYLILLVILGYSFLLKKIAFNKDDFIVENIDILYGLSLIIFISLFSNFFLPLIYLKTVTIIIGFLLFIYMTYNGILKINLLLYFLIIFFTTFIAFYSGMNVDSPMYHLQVIKWLTLNKISFGLSNLEIRLGFNSSWHSLVAILDLNIHKFYAKYYISALILASLIYETTRKKIRLNYSDIFLYLTISFLIFYSFLHPYLNGVILNHLGNPERDIIGMLFFFLIIFFFLKALENPQNNKNYINLLIISLFLCITTRLMMSPMVVLLIFILLKSKNYNVINFTTIFLFITSILWVIRSFFLSGCLFFPFYQTCFKTSWAVNVKEVQFFVEEAMRISRTLPTRNGVNDKNFSLHGYEWINQWINDYFFSAALLQIGSVIIVTVIFLFFIISFFNRYQSNNVINKSDLCIFTSLVAIILLWFISAPETRYALGPLISLPCFFLILLFKKIDLIKYFTNKNLILSSIMGILCLLFISKNFYHFQFKDLFVNSRVIHNYSHIEKLGRFDDTNFYSGKFLCADFKEICVNTIKENYIIDKIFYYKVYKSDTWLKE
tara:strand:- start:266 stop:1933 length:1668 start_codon:yes stop_codon:yes gene_type:complete